MNAEVISMPNRNRERRSAPASHKLLFFVLILLGFIFQITNHTRELPDYESYMYIYENSSLAFISGWDPAFVGLAAICNALGISYDEFRGIVAAISIASLITAFTTIRKAYAIKPQGGISNFPHLVFLIICTPIFYLEFFVVRIRGGISLSLSVLALSLFLSYAKTKKKSAILMAALFFALSYFCHAFTASVLILLLFIPATLSTLKIRPDSLKIKIGFFIAGIALITSLVQNNSGRGEHLFSELNFYRLFAISAIPLLLITIDKFQRKDFHAIAQDNSLGRFIYYLRLSYLSLALVLIPAYALGYVDQAGEAIVRIFTLSSIMAIIGILFSNPKNKILWSYLLVVNSAFFVNTIYLSPYA